MISPLPALPSAFLAAVVGRRWWLVALWLFGAAGARGQTIAVGSTAVPVVAPATSAYQFGPVYRSGNDAASSFNYSRYAHLYTAAELGVPPGARITALAWLKSDAGTITGANRFGVLLENSTLTGLGSSQTWGTLAATAAPVYTSAMQQITGAAGDYFSIALPQPFTYTGGNLLVLTDWEKQGSASGAVSFVTNPAAGLALGAATSAAQSGTTTLTAASYGNRRPTLRVTYTPGNVCAAPPVAGTTRASAAAVCAGAQVTLSLQGASYGTGMAYQWQESATGATYTDIAAATGPTYTTGLLTATRYYRARLTCSGQSAVSVPAQVSVNVPAYATLPLTQTFEASWTDACGTRDAAAASWRTNPLAGNGAWRREDDGVSAGWTSPSAGSYTPAGSQSAHSARFHSFYAGAGAVGNLDLYVNLSAPGRKVLTFDYVNTAGNDSLAVLVSTDGGATFGAPVLRLGLSGNAGQGFVPQSVVITASSATAVVRFQGRVTTEFTSDIGLDNVALDALSAAPDCATSLAPANNTTGVVRTPTITWAGGGGGATSYDVYFGTAVPLTFIGNQSTTSYEPAALLPGTDYYYQIVPRNVNGPAVGCPLVKFTTTSTAAYCSTDLGAYCGPGSANISSVTLSTLNNLNSGCSISSGSGYTAYSASGTTTTTLFRGLTYQLAVTTPEAASISAWLDFDQNGTFDASEWILVTTASPVGQPATVTITIPPAAPLGATGLRIRSRLISNVNGPEDACTNFGSGETEDYIVTIGVAPACAPPTSLSVGSVTTTGATLSFVPGTAGGSFSVIYGAPAFNPATGGTTLTTTSPTVSITGLTPNTAYQFYVRQECGSSTSPVAGPVSLTTACLPPVYAALPIAESFENTWASGCSTNDVPTTNWRNTPAAGNGAWRRDDDGLSAGWTSPSSGEYTPAGSRSSRSARFHSYHAGANAVGVLDLFVDLSAAGTKRLLFDYVNTAGNDSLFVSVSEDGGTTFGADLLKLGTSNSGALGFEPQNLNLTGTSATSVIRFRAKVTTAFTSDIGLDNVQVELLSNCLVPVGLQVLSITATAARVAWASAGPGPYTVVYGPAGFVPGGAGSQQITGITDTNATISGLAPATEYEFYVRQECGSSFSQSAGPVAFRTDCVVPVYAPVPLSETFENSWLSRCATREVPGNAWRTSPQTGNNSWRRDDDGAAANWTSATSYGYTPTGAQGSSRSARFHSGYSSAGLLGTLDLYVDLSGAGSRELSFDYINTSGTDSLSVQISTDGGLSFGPQLLRSGQAASWQSKTLALSSSSATTVIRFRARADYGSTDIGLDNVTIAACGRVSNLAVGSVTGTSASVTFTPLAGVSSYTVVATPTGGGGPAVSVTAPGSPVNLVGLQGLTAYTVSVVSSCGPGQSSVPVTAGFTTLLPPTLNDEPCNATSLSIGGGAYGTPVASTTLGATFTLPNGYSAVGCVLASAPRDVWFEFTPPAGPATPVSIVVTGNPAGQVRVFSAPDCTGPFTQLACQGAPAANTPAGAVIVNSLSAGTRYFVAVSGFGSNDPQGPFTIQAGTGVLASKTALPAGEVSVYPNPSSTGTLTLAIRGTGSSATGEVLLLNALGRAVLTEPVMVRAGQSTQLLRVAHLAKGLYTLRLQLGSGVVLRKVVLN